MVFVHHDIHFFVCVMSTKILLCEPVMWLSRKTDLYVQMKRLDFDSWLLVTRV